MIRTKENYALVHTAEAAAFSDTGGHAGSSAGRILSVSSALNRRLRQLLAVIEFTENGALHSRDE